MSEPSTKLKLLDLFSGIGGFSLGLERSGGFETVAFCEIEPFCRKVLAKHWPTIPCYDDIKTLTKDRLHADGIIPDAICGGFPCQDISTAGKGVGIAGKRSGLWSEYVRLIGEIRPKYIIVENVAALLGRGISRVLGDLASIGYDAEWHCIPAFSLDAPHPRDRVWIVAYPSEVGRIKRQILYPNFLERFRKSQQTWSESRTHAGVSLRDGRKIPHYLFERVDDGLPDRLDRLGALGNAVVPQIAEMIGRAIMASEAAE